MSWLFLVLTTLLTPIIAPTPGVVPAAPMAPAAASAPESSFEAFGFVMGEARGQVLAREPRLQALPGGTMAVQRKLAGEPSTIVLNFLDDRLIKVTAGFNLEGGGDADWAMLLAHRLEAALSDKLGGPPVQKHDPVASYRLLVDDYYLAVWPQGPIQASVQVNYSRGKLLVLVVYEAVAAADRIQQQLRRDLVNDL